MESLSTAIITNRSFISLDLRNNRISGSSASYIFDIIRQSSLQSLDLRWNELDVNCAKGLIVALKNNARLTKVEVAGNYFDESVSLYIEETIRRNMKENLVGKEIMKTVISPYKTLPEFPLVESELGQERRIPEYLTQYDAEVIEKERVEWKLNDVEKQLREEREKNMEIREELLKAGETEKKVPFL